MPKPTLGFVGAGKVGHTLARLWSAQGYIVRAVHSRTLEHAQAIAAQVGAAVVQSTADVVQAADLTLLTVPDGAIHSVAAHAAKGLEAQGKQTSKAVIHTSGVLSMDALSPLAELGFMTGSLHPAFPFADAETAIAKLPGATFGVEAGWETLNVWFNDLVAAVNGQVFNIPSGGKATYHSAFVFASNYVVTLYAIAEKLLLSLGAEREVADNALNGLLAGTATNLARQGIPDALTGPLVRCDAETIRLHLGALISADYELADLYTQLARLSLPMLEARHIDTAFVEQLLK
jgi:predicted short-subunit dehydrogenase-like oxidoreductase (DUF2520 family)